MKYIVGTSRGEAGGEGGREREGGEKKERGEKKTNLHPIPL